MIPSRRRDYRSLATSLALHVVGIALLVRIVMVPSTIMSIFRDEPRVTPQSPEKLFYIPLAPRRDSSVARVQVDGGDGRKAAPNLPVAPMLRAPVTVPNDLPPAPKVAVTPGEPGGSGPLIDRKSVV